MLVKVEVVVATFSVVSYCEICISFAAVKYTAIELSELANNACLVPIALRLNFILIAYESPLKY